MNRIAAVSFCALSLCGPAALAQTNHSIPIAPGPRTSETTSVRIYAGQNVVQITPGANALWVADQGAGTLTGHHKSCLQDTIVQIRSPSAFSLTDKSVFVGQATGGYSVYDPSTGNLLESYPALDITSSAMSVLTVGNYTYYLTVSNDSNIRSYAEGTNSLSGLGSASAPAYATDGTVRIIDNTSQQTMPGFAVYAAYSYPDVLNPLIMDGAALGYPVTLFVYAGQPAILTDTGTVMPIPVPASPIRTGSIPTPANVSLQSTAKPSIIDISDVAYDGHSVWMLSPSAGLWRVDPSAKSGTQVDATTGLKRLLYTGTTIVGIGEKLIAKWSAQDGTSLGTQTVNIKPTATAYDGTSVWIADQLSGTVRNDLVQ